MGGNEVVQHKRKRPQQIFGVVVPIQLLRETQETAIAFRG